MHGAGRAQKSARLCRFLADHGRRGRTKLRHRARAPVPSPCWCLLPAVCLPSSTAGVHCAHFLSRALHAHRGRPAAGRQNHKKSRLSDRTSGRRKFKKIVRLSFSFTGRCSCIMTRLVYDASCSDLRMVSPPFCGSSPYPCRSLTYQTTYSVTQLSSYVNGWFMRIV